MREILFRGKRVDNSEWVYGDLCTLMDGIAIAFDRNGEYVDFYVDKNTIGQYTGLKDKFGAMIYEGDFLRIPENGVWDKFNYCAYEVFFHDNDMCVSHIGFQMNRVHYCGSICGSSHFPSFIPKVTATMIVIGNIHDTPQGAK